MQLASRTDFRMSGALRVARALAPGAGRWTVPVLITVIWAATCAWMALGRIQMSSPVRAAGLAPPKPNAPPNSNVSVPLETTAQPTATSTSAAPSSGPTAPGDCTRWQCTCQGFSDQFDTWRGHWGNAPETTRQWWTKGGSAAARPSCTTMPSCPVYGTEAASGGTLASPGRMPQASDQSTNFSWLADVLNKHNTQGPLPLPPHPSFLPNFPWCLRRQHPHNLASSLLRPGKPSASREYISSRGGS